MPSSPLGFTSLLLALVLPLLLGPLPVLLLHLVLPFAPCLPKPTRSNGSLAFLLRLIQPTLSFSTLLSFLSKPLVSISHLYSPSYNLAPGCSFTFSMSPLGGIFLNFPNNGEFSQQYFFSGEATCSVLPSSPLSSASPTRPT